MVFRKALLMTAVYFAMSLVGVAFESVLFRIQQIDLFASNPFPKPSFLWEAGLAKYLSCAIGFGAVHMISAPWTKTVSRGVAIFVSVLAALGTIILVHQWQIRQAVETTDLRLEAKGATLFMLVGGVAGVLSASLVAVYAKIRLTEQDKK